MGKPSYGDLCISKVDRLINGIGELKKYIVITFEGVTSICRLIHDCAGVE